MKFSHSTSLFIPHRQRGVILFVAMIMLVLLTMLAITGMNLGKTSLQTVGNMQQRNQVVAAAQQVVEEVISAKRFFETPNKLFSTPCGGIANSRCVDINADATDDITVNFTPQPTCVKVQTLKNSTLNLSDVEDFGCLVGSPQNFGTEGSVTGNSLCSNSVWQLRAQATDIVTLAQAVVMQGAAVRVSTDNIATSCP